MKKSIVTHQCYHTCPQSDGNKPHEGGKVITGSSTVYVNEKMVCRDNDQLQCKSPNPDFATASSTSVFVNGRAAIGKGDSTAHGGIITEGSSDVYIG